MNFAVWNVRGLNKSAHQKELKHFISSNKISFMACVETKVKEKNSVNISRKISRRWSWFFNYNHHSNGRIWVGFDNSIWSITVMSSSSQHTTCNVTFLEKQCNFMVTFVYAHNSPHQREELWRDIESLSTTISVPWCLLGDLNCILDLTEVNGGLEHLTADMQKFKDCVADSGITNLKTVGELLTWCNNQPGNPIHKRLDRILVNSSWLHTFSDSLGQAKQRGLMDHCPLLVHTPMQLEEC